MNINTIVQKYMEIGMPFIYAVAVLGVIYSLVRFAWKTTSDPDKKGKYFQHMIISICCMGAIFTVNTIGVIWIKDFSNLLN